MRHFIYLLLFVASSAFACAPTFTIGNPLGTGANFTGGSAAAACASISGKGGPGFTVSSAHLHSDPAYCVINILYDNGTTGYSLAHIASPACTACSNTNELPGENGFGTSTACVLGCIVTTSKVPVIDLYGGGSGSYYFTFTRYTTSTTGDTCNPDAFTPQSDEVPNDPNAPFAPCPENTSYGHINGVEVCVPNGNNIAGFEPYTGTGTGGTGTGTGGTGTGTGGTGTGTGGTGTGTGGTGTGTGGFGDGTGGDPGMLEEVPLYNENKDVSVITPRTGFGPSSASCPAGKTITVSGRSIEIGFTTLCEFADMIRPLVIAFAWMSAALTFFGFARSS